MPIRKCLTVLGALFLIAGAENIRAADTRPRKPLGLMAVQGSVWVDRLLAPSSTTVFAGDAVKTDSNSAAVMQLRSGVTASLLGNSEVVLAQDPSVDYLNLRHGVLSIRNSGSQAARVRVLGASVVVKGREGFPAVCRISALGEIAAVFADKGQVEIHGSGAPILLREGKVARLEAGGHPASPQAGQKAGTVSGAIPAETVQRQGQGTPIPLNVRDQVNWQDLVETQNTGRVRVSLLDGSVLNVGARSVMRIVRHDPQSQQTQVEFTLGRMRGEVIKLTKPGSSFEVRTQTAVIGVVGTIFVIVAEPNLTRVFCIQGLLTVQNINPAILGAVRVGPGQSTSVPQGAPPASVVQTPPTEVQSEVSQTNVQPTTTAAGPAGPSAGGAGGAAPSVGMSATSAASAAAGGVAAGAGIAAVTKIDDATDILKQTDSSAQQAIDAANAATTAINEANQPILSPSTPCGCGQ